MKKLAGLFGLLAFFALPLCSCTITTGGGTTKKDTDTEEEDDDEDEDEVDLESSAKAVISKFLGKSASKVSFSDYDDLTEEDFYGTPYCYSGSGLTVYGIFDYEEKSFSTIVSNLKSAVSGYTLTDDGEGVDNTNEYCDLVYKKGTVAVCLYANNVYDDGSIDYSIDVFEYSKIDDYYEWAYGSSEEYEYITVSKWSDIPVSQYLGVSLPSASGSSFEYYAEDGYIEIYVDGGSLSTYSSALTSDGYEDLGEEDGMYWFAKGDIYVILMEEDGYLAICGMSYAE